MEIKILKTCANCKYAIEIGCNKYYCPIQDYEVKWCGTCPKHKLIENEKEEEK